MTGALLDALVYVSGAVFLGLGAVFIAAAVLTTAKSKLDSLAGDSAECGKHHWSEDDETRIEYEAGSVYRNLYDGADAEFSRVDWGRKEQEEVEALLRYEKEVRYCLHDGCHATDSARILTGWVPVDGIEFEDSSELADMT